MFEEASESKGPAPPAGATGPPGGPSTTSPRLARSPEGFGLWDLISLRRTRGLVRGWSGRALVAGVAGIYAFVALLTGSMLHFLPTGASGWSVQVFQSPSSPDWWNYPAVYVVAPSGVLILPFFATVSMVVVALGVGVGMAAGLRVAARVIRQWRSAKNAPGSARSLAGLTPAMVAALTLGACCSTGAAAASGLGVVAIASGVSATTVAVNAWYLNVLQMVVLGVALVAQEGLLTVYANLLEAPTPSSATRALTAPTGKSGSFPFSFVRVLLLAGGTVWGLAFLLQLSSLPSSAPWPGAVADALLTHLVPALLAIALGVYPTGLRRIFSARRSIRVGSVG